jgi:hypothetical protein
VEETRRRDDSRNENFFYIHQLYLYTFKILCSRFITIYDCCLIRYDYDQERSFAAIRLLDVLFKAHRRFQVAVDHMRTRLDESKVFRENFFGHANRLCLCDLAGNFGASPGEDEKSLWVGDSQRLMFRLLFQDCSNTPMPNYLRASSIISCNVGAFLSTCFLECFHLIFRIP